MSGEPLSSNPKIESEDDRYIVVKGRRWRKSDPSIPPNLHSELVHELMNARREVGRAKRAKDQIAERAARDRVHDAKTALGERGREWWLTPDEESMRNRLACAIRTLLRGREEGKTICPSDAARVVGGDNWRDAMTQAREVAVELVEHGWLEITQGGSVVTPPFVGPIRLRKAECKSPE